jgi:hypothetical protein
MTYGGRVVYRAGAGLLGFHGMWTSVGVPRQRGRSVGVRQCCLSRFFLVRAAPEQRGCVVLVSGELGGEFWYLWYGGWRGDVLTWVSGAWSGGRWVGWWWVGGSVVEGSWSGGLRDGWVVGPVTLGSYHELGLQLASVLLVYGSRRGLVTVAKTNRVVGSLLRLSSVRTIYSSPPTQPVKKPVGGCSWQVEVANGTHIAKSQRLEVVGGH